MTKVDSLESVRATCSKFVNDREWNKFHTPVNLMLALNGEIGELQEIFQWKGDFKTPIIDKELFTEKEYVNIGEEISDVFIYTTRLADMCSIDLSKSVLVYLNSNDNINIDNIDYLKQGESFDSSLTFFELQKLTEKHLNPSAVSKDLIVSSKSSVSSAQKLLSSKSSLSSLQNSPRRLSLAVQQSAARCSSLFCVHEESESIIGLQAWNKQTVAELALSLASIIVLLSLISKAFGYSLGTCISDKFEKNSAKYPADRVKGSSAKYTHYQNMKNNKIINFIDNKITYITIGIILGYALSRLKL